MSNPQTPLPCPFCGAGDEDLTIQGVSTEDLDGWAVCCERCLAEGPISADGESYAIEAWNKRHS